MVGDLEAPQSAREGIAGGLIRGYGRRPGGSALSRGHSFSAFEKVSMLATRTFSQRLQNRAFHADIHCEGLLKLPSRRDNHGPCRVGHGPWRDGHGPGESRSTHHCEPGKGWRPAQLKGLKGCCPAKGVLPTAARGCAARCVRASIKYEMGACGETSAEQSAAEAVTGRLPSGDDD